MASPLFCKIEDGGSVITAGCGSPESIGTLDNPDHPDEFMVHNAQGGVKCPRDPVSGQTTGKRVHAPITLTKYIDACSPLLFQATCKGTRFDKVTLTFTRIDDGTEVPYYEIIYENVLPVEVSLFMPPFQDEESEKMTHMEVVSMTFKKITHTHLVSTPSASDEWGRSVD